MKTDGRIADFRFFIFPIHPEHNKKIRSNMGKYNCCSICGDKGEHERQNEKRIQKRRIFQQIVRIIY
jgi:hypothetical protein